MHSFTQSGLGPYFLSFLITVTLAYSALLIFRSKQLRSPAEFESYLSREAAFLFNNLMLVGIAFAVFWGTIFPVLSEAVRGVKITVGPPFFNRVNGPLALGLVFLMGIGPLIAWRRTTADNLIRSFTAPVAIGVATGIVAAIAGLRQWYVLTAFSLAAFVIGTVLVEFRRGVNARRHMVAEPRAKALVNLVAKNNRRYGGYIIHVGVIVAFVGIVGSSFFRTEVKKSVHPGDSFTIGSYTLRFQGLDETDTPHRRERHRTRPSARRRRPRDHDDGAGEAVLQTPAAACDQGRNSLDAHQRPLRRTRRNRRQRPDCDLRSFSDASRLLALGRRPDDGDRHGDRDVAERSRARRNCNCAQPLIDGGARTRRRCAWG